MANHRLGLGPVKKVRPGRVAAHRMSRVFVELGLEADAVVGVEVRGQTPRKKPINHPQLVDG